MSTEDRVNKAMSDLIIANMYERYKDANLPEIKGVHLKNSVAPSSEAFFDGWSSALKAVVAEFVLGHEEDEGFNKLLNEAREFAHETLKDNPTDETLQSLVHTQLCAKLFEYIRSKCDSDFRSIWPVPEDGFFPREALLKAIDSGLEGDELNSPLTKPLHFPVIDSLAELGGETPHMSNSERSRMFNSEKKIVTAPTRREADAMIEIRDAGRDRSIPTGIFPSMTSINKALDGGLRTTDLIAAGMFIQHPISKSTLSDFVAINIQKRRDAKKAMLENQLSDGKSNTSHARDDLQRKAFMHDLDVSSIYAYQFLPYVINFNSHVCYTLYNADGISRLTVSVGSPKKHQRRLRQIQKAIAHSKGEARASWKAEYKTTTNMREQFIRHINTGLMIRCDGVPDTLIGKTIIGEDRVDENYRLHDESYGALIKDLGDNDENA